MRAAVVVFPGSNCDRDVAVALRAAGAQVTMAWHRDDALPPGTDLVALPGGFSFGDYLRCGAIAARSPICRAVAGHARAGGYVIGICNGFQILTEMGLLPGVLMRNAGLLFVCKVHPFRIATADSAFTDGYEAGQPIRLPVAHHDGNYLADPETVARLQGEDRVALTYAEPLNGSAAGIAGLLSANRRVLGLMPHPERAADPTTGGIDGQAMFRGLVGQVAAA